MALRRRQRRATNDEVPTTTISTPVNWTIVLVVVGALVFGIPMIFFSIRLLDVLSESDLRVVGSIAGTIALVVAVTLCWTLVVVAYSKLRSKEDREEELAELRLLRAIQQGVTPNVSPTYQVGPPMDQAAWMEMLRQQQPVQVPATVIDFEQPVDFS